MLITQLLTFLSEGSATLMTVTVTIHCKTGGPPRPWTAFPRFLETITTRGGTRIEVNVYRNSTYTDRYLDFYSHHSVNHKRSVVSILLRWGKNIPLTQKGEETKRVKTVLRENNYPASFITS